MRGRPLRSDTSRFATVPIPPSRHLDSDGSPCVLLGQPVPVATRRDRVRPAAGPVPPGPQTREFDIALRPAPPVAEEPLSDLARCAGPLKVKAANHVARLRRSAVGEYAFGGDSRCTPTAPPTNDEETPASVSSTHPASSDCAAVTAALALAAHHIG